MKANFSGFNADPIVQGAKAARRRENDIEPAIKLTIRLSPHLHEKLRRASYEERRPISEIIRELIEKHKY